MVADSKILEAQKAYGVKKDWLDSNFDALTPSEFYRSLYPSGTFEPSLGASPDYTALEGDQKRPNGIVTEVLPQADMTGRTSFRYLVTDDLEELKEFEGSDRFGLMAPVGYSGKSRDLRHAYKLYALTFDLDEPVLGSLFGQINGGVSPMPTYTILSGHGLHLYYQFEEPQALYPRNKKAFKTLKFALTRQLWNVNTSRIEKPQYQGINQGFRIVGAASKLGVDYPVRAWRSGPPVSREQLADYLLDEKDKAEVIDAFNPSAMTWDQAKEKYPEWAARKTGESPQTKWHIKRDLYDWWLRQWRQSTQGHRYFYLMCLAVYARKCDISREELERDASALTDKLTLLGDMNEPVTSEDVKAALKAYDDKYTTFTRDAISHITAIPMPHNRRNGLKQNAHLEVARAIKKVKKAQGIMAEEGRPEGSGIKKDLVLDYVSEHPEENPTQIARSLGISRPTVYKYLRRPQGS
jgi:hypothetical protein